MKQRARTFSLLALKHPCIRGVPCAYINAEISPVRRPSSDSSRVYIYGNLDYGASTTPYEKGGKKNKNGFREWNKCILNLWLSWTSNVRVRMCVCVYVGKRRKGKGENAWRYWEGVNAKINETEISFLIHFSISPFCFPYSPPFMREFRSVCERAPRFGNYLLQRRRNYVASADS